MSTALALAATTKVLTSILDDGLTTAGLTNPSGMPDIDSTSALPPDLIDPATLGKTRLNVFLYNVSYNPGWREQNLPSRDSQGDRSDNPPLALDLHYLVTSYGVNPYEQEVALGVGMQVLHENPVLYRAKINSVMAGLPSAIKVLATSGLADQIEMIKIAPHALGYEELSKLWTAFQSKFRPSAAYMLSVLLIESTFSARSSLPVTQRVVTVVPLREPGIAAVDPPSLPFAPTALLTLIGENLDGPSTGVRFNAQGDPLPPASVVNGSRILAALPPGLRAGPNTVQVVRTVALGSPATDRPLVASNVAVFLLQPAIANIVFIPPAGAPPPPPRVSVDVSPAPAADQQITLLLTAIAGGVPGDTHAITAPAGVIAGATVTFPLPAAPPLALGSYLVRVRVDGAESILHVDPATRRFDGPLVVLS
jgi:Pvc16 N-terminal domain